MPRTVVKLDIAAFMVSVERVKDPSISTRPVVVASLSSDRSIVLSASIEAFTDGIYKGMDVSMARKLCPALRVIPPDGNTYRKAMHDIHNTLSRYSPLIEPQRLGHFAVDMSGTHRLFGPPQDMGWKLHKELYRRFALFPTVGIARNKLVSGIAAKVIQRPKQDPPLQLVRGGSEASFLAPHNVLHLPVIKRQRKGPPLKAIIDDLNIRIIRQLQTIQQAPLAMAFGPLARLLKQQAVGVDPSPVFPKHQQPQAEAHHVFDDDTNEDPLLLACLKGLVEECGFFLRQKHLIPKTLRLRLLFSDDRVQHRQSRIPFENNTDTALFNFASQKLMEMLNRRTSIRRMEIIFTRLKPQTRQLSLFSSQAAIPPRDTRLNIALDKIRDKFGTGSVQTGCDKA